VGLPLKVIFRTVASPTVGYGHLMRCRVLANALKDLGVACVMVGPPPRERTEADAGVFDAWLEQSHWSSAGDDARTLAALANKYGCGVAVLDDYRVDLDYQKVMLEAGLKWLQFDTFAGQKMLANWVLSANAAASHERYKPLRERSETLFLLGPKYALLRPEFIEWKPRHRFSENVQKIVLTFGGRDDRGAALFCLTALTHVWESIEAEVLLRNSSPHLMAIQDWVSDNQRLKINIKVDEPEIARCMNEADLALIAGGMTTFEVASMGLPALILPIADNQALNSRAWDGLGAAKLMGSLEKLTADDVRQSVQLLLQDPAQRHSMSEAGKSLVDGLGSRRVANILLNKKMPEES
jgi:UDP-2,4-diacetamido-2,4,6-trideoxy-beta-L-altropyranose hydrolase